MPAITFANRHVGDYNDSRPADSRGAPWVFADPQRLRRLAFPTSFPEAALTGTDYWSSLLPSAPARAAIPGLTDLDAFSAAQRFGGDLFGGFAFEGGVEEGVVQLSWNKVAEIGERWWLAPTENLWPVGLRGYLPGRSLKIPVILRGEGVRLPGAHSASTHLLHYGHPGELLAARRRLLGEAILMSVARRLGLAAVQTRLRRDPWALIVARFDRSVTARGQVLRRQALTARQLFRLQGAEDFGWAAVMRLVDTVSSQPAVDKLHLIRQMIFCQLCGAEGIHAGRVAFILSKDRIELAPVSGLRPGEPGLDHFTVGGATAFEWMQAHHWERFALDAGVAPGLVFTEIRRMADRERINICFMEAAREHCKGRLDLDYAATLASEIQARTLRCRELVVQAKYQKIPRIAADEADPDAPRSPSFRDAEPDSGEPIYE